MNKTDKIQVQDVNTCSLGESIILRTLIVLILNHILLYFAVVHL